MKKKDKIIIVTERALDRREAQRRQVKQIITLVIIIAVVALVVGGIILFKKIKPPKPSLHFSFGQKQESLQEQQADVGEAVNEAGTEAGTEAGIENTEDTVADNVDYPAIESDAKIKDYKGVVVVGDTAYELYTYRENSAKAYAKVVNKLAKQLDGKAQVYDMVIPLSSGITFPDNLQDQVDSTNQREAMTKIMDQMSDKVQTVDIYDALMSHRTDYIYFRTDHHWTALGAYYAYTALCESMGIEPEALEDYETVDFEGFLGSFYNDTESEKLKKNPDTVTAYIPKAETKMHVTPAKGEEYDWDLINDVNTYGASLKYSTFIASDNPFTVIKNQELSDGSSCIVVKESFGNAFVPFLADHYQTIYVVDYRYWNGNLADLAKKKEVKDVILLNNLSMIRNQYLVGQLQGVIE